MASIRILLTLCSILALLIGITVLAANFHRKVNQTLSHALFLLGGWAFCILKLGSIAPSDYETQLYWLRGNLMIISWMPLLLWRLKEAIIGNDISLRAWWRMTPWVGAGLTLSLLSLSDGVFTSIRTESGITHRGVNYYIFIIIEMITYSAILIQSIVSLKKQKGLQRVELQVFITNFCCMMLVAAALNGIGSLSNIPELKRATLTIPTLSFIVIAWTICVRRILTARQVILAIAHWIIGIGVMAAVGMLVDSMLPSSISNRWQVSLSAVAAGIAGLAAALAMRKAFDLDGHRVFTRMRDQTIQIARTAIDQRALINQFEERLRTWANTSIARAVTAAQADNDLLEIIKCFPPSLRQEGWISAESLRRHRTTEAVRKTENFLNKCSINLIIITPAAHDQIDLIITLGEKNDQNAYTYPEIQNFAKIAEIFDNIITRSRLTEQAVLQAKMEHLAMMSRGLAHDLKNLITPVSSFLVHTDGRYPSGSVEAEVHAAARRSVRVMGDYVRDTLFFSTRLAPKMELVDLARLFISVREVVSNRTQSREVQLLLKETPATSLEADSILLQRMLVNLVNNAIDASPPDGIVSIWAETSRPGWCCLVVQDRGEGIAPENLDRIFDPYFTTKQFGDEVRGFGLGLTIADKIACLHGGRIFVASQLGIGTTMTVELPITHDAACTANLPATSAVPARKVISLPLRDEANAPA